MLMPACVSDCAGVVASPTCTVRTVVAALQTGSGVPLISPVAGSRSSGACRLPAVIDQASGSSPPSASSEAGVGFAARRVGQGRGRDLEVDVDLVFLRGRLRRKRVVVDEDREDFAAPAGRDSPGDHAIGIDPEAGGQRARADAERIVRRAARDDDGRGVGRAHARRRQCRGRDQREDRQCRSKAPGCRSPADWPSR